ncbi:MAG: helix-turn-helix transcriptional regulator [Bacilli bacterium]|nr:helix-turn-helix transcriptional regulator [Bacilli bacterium]
MSYNKRLFELRRKRGLSLSNASKAIGISKFSLSLYERGLFKPNKKALAKLSSFYEEDISLEGEESYPTPIIPQGDQFAPSRKRRIILGSIALGSLLLSIFGGSLFAMCVNGESNYGEIHDELSATAMKKGGVGHDVVTAQTYHYLEKREENLEEPFEVYAEKNEMESTLYFYDSPGFLHFSEATYVTKTKEKEKFTYSFGKTLMVSSYECEFTYTKMYGGIFLSATFDYLSGDITEIKTLKVVEDAQNEASEGFVLSKINRYLDQMEDGLSSLIEESIGQEAAFHDEFLKARERGRVINLAYQSVGLTMLFLFGILFFVFAILFALNAIWAYEVSRRMDVEENRESSISLPNDINIPFGLSHNKAMLIAIVLTVISYLFIFVSLLSKIGLFPEVFSYVYIVDIAHHYNIGALILCHLLVYMTSKDIRSLGKLAIVDGFAFLVLSVVESLVLMVAGMWGLSIETLMANYIPVNIRGLCFALTLMAIFLFYDPKFIKTRGNLAKAIYRCLSILPLAFYFLSLRLGVSFLIDYGVETNIFRSIWFPTTYFVLMASLPVSIVLSYLHRLFIKLKYKDKAKTFLYGERYGLIEKIIFAAICVVTVALDYALSTTQTAYYMKIGGNYWFLILAVLPFFIKAEPTTLEDYRLARRS